MCPTHLTALRHHLVPFQPIVRELRPCVAESDALRLNADIVGPSPLSICSALGQEGPPVVFMLAKAAPAGPADLKVVVGERGGQGG